MSLPTFLTSPLKIGRLRPSIDTAAVIFLIISVAANVWFALPSLKSTPSAPLVEITTTATPEPKPIAKIEPVPLSCPLVTTVTRVHDGWTSFESPVGCFTLAYPTGWTTKETEAGVTFTYDDGDAKLIHASFAFIGRHQPFFNETNHPIHVDYEGNVAEIAPAPRNSDILPNKDFAIYEIDNRHFDGEGSSRRQRSFLLRPYWSDGGVYEAEYIIEGTDNDAAERLANDFMKILNSVELGESHQ